MIELREWTRSSRFDDKPWLVLGKGPTFSRRDEFQLADYNLLGLNNVVGEMNVDVAHIIDIDVARACADRLLNGCGYLLMPRRPHVDFLATGRLLEDFFDEIPVLRELDRQQRLVWYNARTGGPVGNSPVIRVRYFSSEAAIDILGEMGVRTVRTLGIDGGRGYGREFSGLPQLGNGLPTFDAQFREIEDIVHDRGLDYDPLVEPLRVYVGVDDSQIIAARVLEYSIRKHATRPVRFIPMVNLPTPVPKDRANRARTGFSFSRFQIPQLANHKGRALYLDADMQVFGDLAELWDVPFGDHKVLCTRQDQPPAAWEDYDWFHPGRQMSVMMLDCERLDWDIQRIVDGLDAGEYDYAGLLFDLAITPEADIGDYLPPEWNHLEHFEAGETKLLHYTVVGTQPWKNDKNPLREIWEAEFEEAKAAGLIHPYEIRRLVRAGYLKRSLVGKPPASRPIKAFNRVISKTERGLLRADERIAALRAPRVARLRSRLGLL
jgi:Glycosyl transferase family 8